MCVYVHARKRTIMLLLFISMSLLPTAVQPQLALKSGGKLYLSDWGEAISRYGLLSSFLKRPVLFGPLPNNAQETTVVFQQPSGQFSVRVREWGVSRYPFRC